MRNLSFLAKEDALNMTRTGFVFWGEIPRRGEGSLAYELNKDRMCRFVVRRDGFRVDLDGAE
jgi:hypothetical protein